MAQGRVPSPIVCTLDVKQIFSFWYNHFVCFPDGRLLSLRLSKSGTPDYTREPKGGSRCLFEAVRARVFEHKPGNTRLSHSPFMNFELVDGPQIAKGEHTETSVRDFGREKEKRDVKISEVDDPIPTYHVERFFLPEAENTIRKIRQ